MDLLAIVGLVVLLYYLVYLICPWFLDCDLNLAIHEKFGKPIGKRTNYALHSSTIAFLYITFHALYF